MSNYTAISRNPEYKIKHSGQLQSVAEHSIKQYNNFFLSLVVPLDESSATSSKIPTCHPKLYLQTQPTEFIHGKKCSERLNGQAGQNGGSLPFEFLRSLQAAGFRNDVSS